MMGLPGQKEV